MKQEFFDTDDYNLRSECIAAKNKRAKELRQQGYRVSSSILKNQQRGYSGFGSAKDTSCRDVFMLDVSSKDD